MKESEFALLCKLFLEASDEQKQATLDLMTEEEQEVFLLGVGFFKIMTIKEYHDKIMTETMKQYLEQL